MNTYESFENLYKTLEKVFGPIEAKSIASKILYIVLDDLQEESLPVSQMNLEERITKYISDFEEVSRNHVA